MNALSTAARILRRGWAIPVFAVLGLILGAFMAISSPSSYTSTTVLFIGSPISADSAGAYQGDLFSQQRAATYAQLFSSDDLAVKVIDDLGLPMSGHDLASQVSAAAVEKTVLLQVSVTDSTAEGSAGIANAYAKNFAQYVGQLETPNGGGRPNTSVQVVTEANAEDASGGSNLVMTSLFGLFGGLVVGIGVRVLLGRLDRSVRSASMLSAVAGVPILATVPESASRGFRALTFPADGATAYAESIRKLRTGIEFAGPSADAIRSVLIASPRYSEPAGCIAADLAVVLSEAGRRVLLVDGDLRSPSLDSYLGIKPAVGFSDVLAGAIPLVDVLVQVPGRSLTLLPAGSIRSDSGDAIASVSAREMLSEASEKFEYTIVVGPPLSLYSDSAVIGSVVDGVVLVSTQSISSVDEVEGAATTLRAAGANLLGAVLSGVGRGGLVKVRSRVSVVDEPAANEPPVNDASNEPVGAWPPVERGAGAQVVHAEPGVGSTGKNEVDKHDSGDSAESPAEDMRIDFDEWEPAETEGRYTRSDLDSPTVAIPRSMLRTKVAQKANLSSDELPTDKRQVRSLGGNGDSDSRSNHPSQASDSVQQN
ncbi:hypothetical protein RQCS_41320 [Rhodococcus qingshengii]|uniref:polysaccharide biosynthesis tyrosine autokinase n=1 Tax=Rhodococcus qingshengii TaxID=334542 RepID=UPI0009ECC7A5|nr:polysaccharide biosynthesis tyrosine autokinase [Rhodococcus qingshengii]BCF84587.1 hypothetical protein RQCS_41320 [Rhodococcus qingshengii]